MSDEAVRLSIEEGVATVTLNEPGMRNALTREVAAGLQDAFDEIEAEDPRCVVLEGAGEAFSAGGDVNAMLEGIAGDVSLERRVRIVAQETSRAVRRVHECYLPTVALVDGIAFGAGANLALAADLQLASEEMRMGFGFRQVGLAVDSGTSYLLPRVVGENVAKELVFTGELVGPERARDLGLVNRVFETDFEAEAAEVVATIAEGPTVALRTSKRLLRQGLESTFEQAITNEAAAQAQVFATADHDEGARAFMEDREPEFGGE